MKIYFCERCSASIPLKDIRSNRITIAAGSIYCRDCEPASGRPRRGAILANRAVGLAVSLVFGGLIVIGFQIAADGFGGSDGNEVPADDAGLVRQIASLRQDLERVRATLATERGIIVSNTDANRRLSDALAAACDDLQGRIQSLGRVLDEHRNHLRAALENAAETSGPEVFQNLERIHQQLESLNRDVQSLGGRMAGLDGYEVPKTISAPKTLSPRTENRGH